MDLCIDAIAALSAVALYANEPWRLCNVEGARAKESDRVMALCQEMGKLGGRLSYEEGDLVVIPSKLRGTAVSSCFDHRIAMALAVAAMGAEGATHIRDTACVEKSFPQFFSRMKEVGADACPISS